MSVPASKHSAVLETTVMNIVHRLSHDRLGGVLEAVRRTTINLLNGNGHAHLKNWSFMSSPEGKVQLTPAFDVVPTFLYGDNTMALAFGNTKKRPTSSGFRRFERAAGALQVSSQVVLSEVTTTVQRALKIWPDLLTETPLPAEARRRLLERLPKLRLVQEISPGLQTAPASDRDGRRK